MSCEQAGVGGLKKGGTVGEGAGQQKAPLSGGPAAIIIYVDIIIYVELLLFRNAGEYFPPVAYAAEGDLYIRILEGDIVAILAFSGELEEVGDPIIAVVGPEADQQGHRQLRGQDIAGDSQQLSILRIIGEHDHVIHSERELGVGLMRLFAYDLCIVEAL